MAVNKKIDIICVVITVLTLILTVLFINGRSFGVEAYSAGEETAEDDGHFTSSDVKTLASTEDATVITLDGDSTTVTGNGAYYANNKLTIAYKGTYVLKGTLNGQIEVDADGDDKVWLILEGLSVNCQDSAALYIKKADKVFVNLVEGTTNSFESGSTYSASAEKDGIDGTIYSKEDLTINGTGSLSVTGKYAHGLVCNDTLKITGGNIDITAKADGIHANDAVYLKEADITIEAADDGITVSNSENEGDFYMASGKVAISGAYEGIEAVNILIDGGDITISSSDDGFNATATTQGGGVTINGGTVDIINTGGRDADGIDSNRDIIINGGNIFVSIPTDGNALDDGSESGGKIVINGGNVIACGGAMMTQAPDGSGGQCAFMYSVEGKAGDTVSLTDSQGNIIFTREVANAFSVVTASSPKLKTGETYKLSCGSNTYEITLTDTVTSNVQGGGFRGGKGTGGFAGGGDTGVFPGNGQRGNRENFMKPTQPANQ